MCSVRRGAASTARSSPMSGCSIRNYGSVGVDVHGQGLGGIAGGASDRGDVSGSVETLKITSALLRDWDCAHTTPGCGQQKGMFHRAYLAIFASSGVPQAEAERCWLASRFCRPTTAGISGPGLGTSELALPWTMPGVATFRVSIRFLYWGYTNIDIAASTGTWRQDGRLQDTITSRASRGVWLSRDSS